MTYDELLAFYDDELVIIETDLGEVDGLKGLYTDGCIAIHSSMTEVEKSCILAEEVGHHITSSGNILDTTNISNRKQESRARAWAYDKKIGLLGIINCFESNRLYDMADFLNVTEEFLQDAIKYYKNKYGLYANIDNYIVFFEPTLGVLKFF